MKFDRRSLKDLQAKNLPHLTTEDVAQVNETTEESQRFIAILAEYLRAFTGEINGACICCGKPQGSKNLLDGFLNAQFRWGIVHGEGFCANCGYPARACHYIGEKDANGEYPLVLLNAIMQYHPDGLSFEHAKEQEVA